MNIIIRADASIQIGIGHVMRMLSLANTLRGRGCHVSFICRDLPGNLGAIIESHGFVMMRLAPPGPRAAAARTDMSAADWLGVPWEQDASETRDLLIKQPCSVDWIIVDHYGLDFRWQNTVRSGRERILVVDDLADRRHASDVLLDQNLHNDMQTRYHGLVPDACIRLLGPVYALLREQFSAERRRALRMRSGVRRVLIFFGGSDRTNETGKALRAVQSLAAGTIETDVVVGSSNPWKEQVRDLCAAMPGVTYHCQVDDMARLMAHADISIGAGGSATWERCCLGLPSLVVSIADNQDAIAESVHASGAARYLGRHDVVSTEDILTALEGLMRDPHAVAEMSAAASALVDGEGTARVAAVMMSI